jgi:hypothetical protein
MPTIKQLPVATSVAASDLLPVSQGGTTRGLTVGGLLSSTQGALSLVPGKLLGRVSATAGGPEQVGVGSGLIVDVGVIAATGDDHTRLPISGGLLAGDEVVVNSGGAAKRMPASLLRGLFAAGNGVLIDGSGVISAPGGVAMPATASVLGGVKVGPGVAVAADGTISTLSPSAADVSAAGMAVSLLYENSTHPINAEGGVWSNAPYAYVGVSRDFDASVGGTGAGQFGGGNGGPVSALFVFGNNTGTASDAVGIIGDCVARVNNASVFGANFIARSDVGLTGLHLVGCELDIEPAAGAGSVASGAGLAINAFSQAMPIPAIQVGGLGGGTFNNGVVLGAVAGAGFSAGTGASMTSLINTVNGAYADAAIVLGYQHRIKFDGADGVNAYAGVNAGYLHFTAPTNGYTFRDKTDTTDLMVLSGTALALHVGLTTSGPVDFTGAPSAITATAAPGTNTTQIASTAFATAAASTPTTVVATSGAAQTLTAAASGSVAYDITLTANCTLTLAGGVAGQQQSITVYLRQDATAGRVAVLPTGVKWPGGVAPVPGTLAGNVDVFTFTTPDGGATWAGSIAAPFVAPPSTLNAWRRAAAKVATGGGRYRVAVIGDSTLAGYNAGTGTGGAVGAYKANWLAWLTKYLNGVFPTQNNSFFGEQNMSQYTSYSNYDPRVTFGPGWVTNSVTNTPTGGAFTFTNAAADGFNNASATLSFRPDNPVDTFTLYYIQRDGSITVNVDGGAPLTVSAGLGVGGSTVTIPSGYSSFAQGWSTFSVPLGAHTINVVVQSGTTTDIWGIAASNSTASYIDLYQLGAAGQTVAGFNANTANYQGHFLTGYLPIDAAWIDLTVNDVGNGTTLANYSTQMDNLISGGLLYFNGGLNVSLLTGPLTQQIGSAPLTNPLIAWLMSYAAAKNYWFIDNMSRWRPLATAGAGLTGGDNVHPTAAGHHDLGRAMFGRLTQ